jgi:hypothetical protein
MKKGVIISIVIGIVIGAMLFPMITIPAMGISIVVWAFCLLIHEIIKRIHRDHNHYTY